MTGYWDIHNHILPGVDDGSGCMRETMEMLEEEYRQGVRHIVFTPHYRRDMFAIPREEIQTVYARVCKMAADRFPEMEFYLGCEYYIHSDASVERLRGNPKYYMAGSRTVLMDEAFINGGYVGGLVYMGIIGAFVGWLICYATKSKYSENPLDLFIAVAGLNAIIGFSRGALYLTLKEVLYGTIIVVICIKLCCKVMNRR